MIRTCYCWRDFVSRREGSDQAVKINKFSSCFVLFLTRLICLSGGGRPCRFNQTRPIKSYKYRYTYMYLYTHQGDYFIFLIYCPY